MSSSSFSERKMPNGIKSFPMPSPLPYGLVDLNDLNREGNLLSDETIQQVIAKLSKELKLQPRGSQKLSKRDPLLEEFKELKDKYPLMAHRDAEGKMHFWVIYGSAKKNKLLGKGSSKKAKLPQNLTTSDWDDAYVRLLNLNDEEKIRIKKAHAFLTSRNETKTPYFEQESIFKHSQLRQYYMAKRTPGKNLDRVLRDHFAGIHILSDATLMSIAIQVLEKVNELHKKGKIHNDIKPENFMYDWVTNTVYLIDFDTLLDAKDDNSIELDIPFTTKYYRAPEVYNYRTRTYSYSKASDTFSVGYTLHQIFRSNGEPSLRNNHSVAPLLKLIEDMKSKNVKERPSLEKTLQQFKDVFNKKFKTPSEKKTAIFSIAEGEEILADEKHATWNELKKMDEVILVCSSDKKPDKKSLIALREKIEGELHVRVATEFYQGDIRKISEFLRPTFVIPKLPDLTTTTTTEKKEHKIKPTERKTHTAKTFQMPPRLPDALNPAILHHNGKLLSDELIKKITTQVKVELEKSDKKEEKKTALSVAKKFSKRDDQLKTFMEEDKNFPYPIVVEMDEKGALHYSALFGSDKEKNLLGKGGFKKYKAQQNLFTGDFNKALATITVKDYEIKANFLSDIENGFQQLVNDGIALSEKFEHKGPPKPTSPEKVTESHKWHFVSKRISGCDLWETREKHRKGTHVLSLSEWQNIVIQCFELVLEQHNRGIILRDIKIENFMYDWTTKKVTLIDRDMDLQLKDNEKFIISPEQRGTRLFLAPELVSSYTYDKKDTEGNIVYYYDLPRLPIKQRSIGYRYSKASDVYALGCLLLDIYNYLSETDQKTSQWYSLIDEMKKQDWASRITTEEALAKLKKLTAESKEKPKEVIYLSVADGLKYREDKKNSFWDSYKNADEIVFVDVIDGQSKSVKDLHLLRYMIENTFHVRVSETFFQAETLAEAKALDQAKRLTSSLKNPASTTTTTSESKDVKDVKQTIIENKADAQKQTITSSEAKLDQLTLLTEVLNNYQFQLAQILRKLSDVPIPQLEILFLHPIAHSIQQNLNTSSKGNREHKEHEKSLVSIPAELSQLKDLSSLPTSALITLNQLYTAVEAKKAHLPPKFMKDYHSLQTSKNFKTMLEDFKNLVKKYQNFTTSIKLFDNSFPNFLNNLNKILSPPDQKNSLRHA